MQTNESQEGCPWFPLAGRSANGAGAGAGARAKAEGSLLDAHQISKAGASTPGRKGKGAQVRVLGPSRLVSIRRCTLGFMLVYWTRCDIMISVYRKSYLLNKFYWPQGKPRKSQC
ncbi:hypothetical protein MUK42_05150 [Musa troglodytarum]|uniref:Uncharacterized protein n=1 Tax=Musa troglodytarum TaxID=320322 RepID=A0A9E7GEP6_9LILI|nr:hypothetical protein MUK42_05150 [Musa troglodytarum]